MLSNDYKIPGLQPSPDEETSRPGLIYHSRTSKDFKQQHPSSNPSNSDKKFPRGVSFLEITQDDKTSYFFNERKERYGGSYGLVTIPTDVNKNEADIVVKEQIFTKESKLLEELPLLKNESECNKTMYGTGQLSIEEIVSANHPDKPLYKARLLIKKLRGTNLNKFQYRKTHIDFSNIILACLQEAKIMHSLKIIHGDIKSDNIMIYREQDGRIVVKYCDFGLSRKVGELTSGRYNPPTFFDPGSIYMAPQLIRPVPAIEAYDIYALGYLIRDLYLTSGINFTSHARSEIETIFLQMVQGTSQVQRSKTLDGMLLPEMLIGHDISKIISLDQAIENWKKLHNSLFRLDPEYWYHLANYANQMGEVQNAKKLYLKATSEVLLYTDPSFNKEIFLLKLVKTLLGNNNYIDETLECAKSLTTLCPGKTNYMAYLAMALYNKGDYEQAIFYNTQVLESGHQNNPIIHQRIGSAYHCLKNYEQAIRFYLYAQSLEPTNHLHTSLLIQSRNKLVDTYRDHTLGPSKLNCPMFCEILIDALLCRENKVTNNKQDLEDALFVLKHAVCLEPANARLHRKLGIVLYNLGHLSESKIAHTHSASLESYNKLRKNHSIGKGLGSKLSEAKEHTLFEKDRKRHKPEDKHHTTVVPQPAFLRPQ